MNMAKRSWTGWFDKHASAIQAVASLVMAMIALAAVVGVKVQIDAAARMQQEQSARDIYREFLNLSISKPEFADPDYCAIKGGPQEVAYRNYVDYLLYAAEQILSVTPEWKGALSEHLEVHGQYLCSTRDWSGYPDSVRAMVVQLKGGICTKALSDCGN
jgi:hypothetical protein